MFTYIHTYTRIHTVQASMRAAYMAQGCSADTRKHTSPYTHAKDTHKYTSPYTHAKTTRRFSKITHMSFVHLSNACMHA
jgi:hypothetical protein